MKPEKKEQNIWGSVTRDTCPKCGSTLFGKPEEGWKYIHCPIHGVVKIA